jgi:hypothetical protein
MSAIRTLVIAAVISTGFTGAAFARDAIFTVKLETPVTEQTRVIANNAVWTCEGDTCVARASHANVRACRQFVREADARVTAYGTEGNELSADEIARCNGDQPAALQAQN